MKLAALTSGGKDSLFAIYKANEQHETVCLISLKPERDDSYMFHVPNIDLVQDISENMGLPLIAETSSGIKEKELEDLERAIKKAKEQYQIEGVVAGAIGSNYQYERVEKICRKLHLEVITPIWQMDEEEYMKELIKTFKVMIVEIAADGLDESWLGKTIDESVLNDLNELNKKTGLNIAGEGGEYESFVLNCPLYQKEFQVKTSEKRMENACTGNLLISLG
ncbi:diphthine--ammonia ligase [Nanoarchaeota archaeon]